MGDQVQKKKKRATPTNKTRLWGLASQGSFCGCIPLFDVVPSFSCAKRCNMGKMMKLQKGWDGRGQGR